LQLNRKLFPDPLLQIGASPVYYAIPLKIRALFNLNRAGFVGGSTA
jgi:hypothetical protein